jgi:dephospho-CoA kinase
VESTSPKEYLSSEKNPLYDDVKRLVVGLAGGVGSGKSTVAKIFIKEGAQGIDADALGHGVLDLPRVRAALARDWGPGILRGGRVDRAALARLAFRSRKSIARLNRRVHPVILREIRRRISRARGWVVLDAALLFETGADALCDVVVFVSAPRALRARRTRARGWGPGELERRERVQLPIAYKKKKADYVIDNTGPKSRTEEQTRRICDELRR